MACKFDTVYISASCNRTPHSADWGANKLICYATSNSVAVYDPKYAEGGKILFVLCGHKERVNSVKWISNNGLPESELISVSSDNNAIVWSQTDEGTFGLSAILKGHTNVVTVADGLCLPHQEANRSEKACIIVATASADSTARIWKRIGNTGEFDCIQTLTFGSGFCLAVRLTFLPGTDAVLVACAADDAKIHLFTESPSDNGTDRQYVQVMTLVGHEDWIRAMDFCLDDFGDLLLASSSQDALIRLWKISPRISGDSSTKKAIKDLDLSEDIRTEEKTFSVETGASVLHFSAALDSVLAGHEGWVYSVDWHPRINLGGGKHHQPMKLLSSSLDKTMMIWEPDASSGVWLESVRVGELGGNTLGFYGGKFGPDGQSIMSHGYQGSFHLWSYSKDSESWLPDVTVGGHFAEVTDMQWEPGGQFLLSVSADQTTRLHAPWVQDDQKQVTWHEIARPQVHGYDISCLAVLSRYSFASGAEEKVIRAFEAPNNFVQNFHRICKIENDKDQKRNNANAIPQGASVPALGLSNKAVYEGQEILPVDRHVKDEYPESYFVALELKEPPTEENLLQNTLWPEVHKLYGHGYEIFALASRSDGRILASSCKATTAEHAAIILWDTCTWKQVQKLPSHQLTVTQMCFSPDDHYLLSVSRDRRWSLFEQNETEPGTYRLVAATDKKSGVHTRIIWCCCWTHDSKHFLTGSREGKLCVWGRDGSGDGALGGYGLAGCPLELPGQSITAVAAAPRQVPEGIYLIALGLEVGHILLYSWAPGNWHKCLQLQQQYAHHLTVKRLAFRPLGEHTDIQDKKSEMLQLASCGSDHAVKIYNIYYDSNA